MRATPRYCLLQPDTALPPLDNTPSMVILVSDAECGDMWRWEVARWLVAGGCRYLLAWGNDCETWHDAVDDASDEALDYEDPLPEQQLISTWHEDEDLDEVFWFARHKASHPVPLARTLIVHIAQQARGEELLAQFADA